MRIAQLCRVTALTAAVGVVWLAPTAPAATAAPVAGVATCHGRAVTIIGTPHGTVVGTEGDDVIDTGGASQVDAGGGDDTICVTGGGGDVVAGPGDDYVDTTAVTEHRTHTYLGTGDDVFVGGARRDDVEATNPLSSHERVDWGTDDVRTGGGADTVGVVRGADGVYDGGAGDDRFDYDVWDDGLVTALTADLPRGRVTVGRRTIARLTSFNDVGVHRVITTHVIGSRTDNQISVLGCQVVVSAGAGDDTVSDYRMHECGQRHVSPRHLVAHGGPGDDVLAGGNGGDVLVGGPGDDSADGGDGNDTCRVEHRISCERR